MRSSRNQQPKHAREASLRNGLDNHRPVYPSLSPAHDNETHAPCPTALSTAGPTRGSFQRYATAVERPLQEPAPTAARVISYPRAPRPHRLRRQRPGPQYMEQALAVMHQANPHRLVMDLLFARRDRSVSLFCRVPPELSAVVTAQLAAHYPTATLDRLPDNAFPLPAGFPPWSAELRLTPDIFPIRRYPQFDDPLNRNASDPLTAIFASLMPDPRDRCVPLVTLTVRPARQRRVRAATKAIAVLSRAFFRRHPLLAHLYATGVTSPSAFVRVLTRALGVFSRRPTDPPPSASLTTTPARAHDREEDLQAASDKIARHLFEVHIRLIVHAPPDAAHRAESHLRQMAGAFGQFTFPRMARFRLSRIHRRPSKLVSRGFLLSCEELATLWHPATATVRAPGMQVTESRELEPPTALPSPLREPDTVTLGRIKFRSRTDLFGIRLDDRRRHLAVIGKTGMGKTTLLHQLVASDMQASRGLALLDPHGDLADAILGAVPRHRTNDVIVFDAGDRDYPLSFNVLASREAYQRGLTASAVVSAFKKLYGESWGPRLEHILRNALLTLLETPGTSLLSLQRLLSDTATIARQPSSKRKSIPLSPPSHDPLSSAGTLGRRPRRVVPPPQSESRETRRHGPAIPSRPHPRRSAATHLGGRGSPQEGHR